MIQRIQSFLRSAFLACVTLMATVNCAPQDSVQQRVVARFADNDSITFAGLQKYVHDYLYSYFHPQRPEEAYEKALEDMLVNQLKRIDFFARGLDSSAEMLQRMRRAINEELKDRYYKTQFYGKYVNENATRNAYKDLGRQVLYQLITLTKPDSVSRHAIDSLRKVTHSIVVRIRKGESMARLAKSYTRDLQIPTGDTVQTLNWQMSLSDTLHTVIFTLQANELRVFESAEAFHIVKIVTIKHVPVQPYSVVQADIRKALDEKYVNPSYEEFQSMKKNLVDETKVTWNSKALRQLLHWSNQPGFYQNSYADTLRKAIAQGHNLVILRHSTTRVDLKEYLRLLDDVLIPARFVTIKEDDLKQFILEAVRTNIIVEKALKLGLQKDVFTARTTNPILKDGILRLYNQHVIEKQIPPAKEQALKEFYLKNKDSLYYQLAKVNLYVAVDSSRTAVIGMKEKLQLNVPFEKIAPSILVKTYIRNRDGTYSTYLGIDRPVLAEAAFQLNLNDVAGPIAFVDSTKRTQYALIKCVGRREEKQLTYEDATKTIAEDLATYHRDRIAQSVKELLKKQYVVKIDNDELQRNLSTIGISSH